MRFPGTSASTPGIIGRLASAAFAAALGSVVLAQGQPPAAQPPAQPPAQAGQGAQAAQQPPAQVPTFRTGANFVRVDAYPTKGGVPVQDLREDEFTILEDGAPQAIQTFEHVVVQAAGAQEARAEPSTVRESRTMAQESKARLFVLFIDTYHISLGGAGNVRKSLINFLNRTLGQDDMVAVMTPEMSAAGVTFARRTETIDELLDKYWEWSRRQRIAAYDPIEENYMACYPPAAGEGTISAMAREMIDRRREKMTLDAMDDLVVHLGGLREERKAVFAVSEGWVIYRPNQGLARTVNGQAPGIPPVGVGADGGLRVGDLGRNPGSTARCDQDRIRLSMEDHDREYRDMLNDANRWNVSFYPIDPRGLPVFDTPLGPDRPVDVVTDAALLRTRQESLATLAVATDGMAIMNSNDIDKGLRRVVDDLSSYYLIGYNSTNTKLDGKYRSITVRVKRPGVDVRARRGYRAPTQEEVDARTSAAPAPGTAGASPVATAVGTLAKVRADAVVQARAGYTWRAGEDGRPQAVLWFAAELDTAAAGRDEQWKSGADLTVAVVAPDKRPLDGLQQTLTREARSAMARIPPAGGLPPGEYALRVTSKPAGTTLGTTETIRVLVPKAAADGVTTGQPILYRRGPFTGLKWLPAGDLRFRRQERVKVEVPVLGAFTAGAVRLLDRAGNPLSLPVTVTTSDQDGAKVIAGEVALAPLSLGDYVLETSFTVGTTSQKVLAAFRIVP